MPRSTRCTNFKQKRVVHNLHTCEILEVSIHHACIYCDHKGLGVLGNNQAKPSKHVCFDIESTWIAGKEEVASRLLVQPGCVLTSRATQIQNKHRVSAAYQVFLPPLELLQNKHKYVKPHHIQAGTWCF
jgi:hypothetical protein